MSRPGSYNLMLMFGEVTELLSNEQLFKAKAGTKEKPRNSEKVS